MVYEIFENLPEEKRELILSTGIKAFSVNTYKDVSTDSITKQCGISKGLLFHYFGSKKDYYLYCLEKSMQRLIGGKDNPTGDDFYGILFDSMNRTRETCMQYQDEMHMVNMASRDASVDVAEGKAEILRRYRTVIQLRSAQTLQKAMAKLEFKDTGRRQITAEGLQLYINAVMNKYLAQYQPTPDRFFENSEEIRQEIRTYLDLMLYGICR